MKEIMNEIEKDMIVEDYDNALNKLEVFLTENDWMLQYATKEETGVYQILNMLKDNSEDHKQLLKNIVEMSGDEFTEEEKNDIMKFNTSFLKITLIIQWLERAEKSLK